MKKEEPSSLNQDTSNNSFEKKKTKLSLDSDETIEMQIINKLLLNRIKSKKNRQKELERELKRKNVKRIEADINQGLSSSQVQQRIEEELDNNTPSTFTKSIFKIITGNVLTYFNLLMFAIAIVLMSFGLFGDLFFLFIVICNIGVGVVQEIRSKKTIDKMRLITSPKCHVVRNGQKEEIPVSNIVLDDILIVQAGNQLGVDAILVEGEVETDESALTGESLPIKKKKGDMLFSGSFVVSGACVGRVEKVGLDTFSGKLQSQAKTYKKNTSQLRRAINSVITIISIVILPITALMAVSNHLANPDIIFVVSKTSASAIGMIPSGLVLLVSVALCVGVINLSERNTSVQDLYSIERLARVDTLCLDKTGTLTDGTMSVDKVKQFDNSVNLEELVSSYLQQFEANNQTSLALLEKFNKKGEMKVIKTLPFSSSRKYSAVTFENNKTYSLGAYEYVYDGQDEEFIKFMEEETGRGNRVLVIVESSGIEDEKVKKSQHIIASFSLIDHVRKEAFDTIKWFRENQVDVKIISGDNPRTVSNIASRCGVSNAEQYISLEGVSLDKIPSLIDQYSIFGRVTPDQKAEIIKSLKAKGKTVAMTGDGVNDILAMKQADCSVAMSNGTDATKAIAHLVLLDSNFASMPSVVKEGRRVVNNIQLSASLFLMKTLFTMLLTVVIICCNLFSNFDIVYPFSPRMMMILEIFVIGLPSFFLALQPNNDLIKGKFLSNVFKQAIPSGFFMFLSVFICIILKFNMHEIEKPGDSTLEVLILLVAGIFPLIKLCVPLNKYRSILLLGSIVLTTILVVFLPVSVIGVNVRNVSLEGWITFGCISLLMLILNAAAFLISKYYKPRKKQA